MYLIQQSSDNYIFFIPYTDNTFRVLLFLSMIERTCDVSHVAKDSTYSIIFNTLLHTNRVRSITNDLGIFYIFRFSDLPIPIKISLLNLEDF